MTRTYAITLYSGANATDPVRRDALTWAEFCDSIAGVLDEPRDEKTDMWSWAPHELKPGGKRRTEDITKVSLVVIDVDRGDLDAIADRIAELKMTALIYTSASDDPDGPADARRFRVITPTDRDMTVAECYRTRFALAEMLGLGPGIGVEGAKEAAKLFFVGRYEGTPERELLEFDEGELL